VGLIAQGAMSVLNHLGVPTTAHHQSHTGGLCLPTGREFNLQYFVPKVVFVRDLEQMNVSTL
jgi:hypothetical protein